MYDLITIGDITIDLFFKGKSLTVKDERFFLAMGGKYSVEEFSENVGGSAANVSIGCSNHIMDTAVLAKVGENSFKQIILQKMVKKNVSTEFLLLDRQFLNISSILLSGSGEKTVVHYATPHERLDLSEVVKSRLLNTKAVYLGSMPNISIKEKASLLQYFKRGEKIIYLNIGTTDIEKGLIEVAPLFALADVLFLNTHEFSQLINKKYEKIDFSKDQVNELKLAKPTLLVLTDGKGGSYSYGNGMVYYQKAVKAQVVDTTGAGDAYTAGFISVYQENKSIEAAMLEGAQYAKKILERLGAN